MQVRKGRGTCVRERRVSLAAQSSTYDPMITDAANIAASSRCMMARSALASRLLRSASNAFCYCNKLADGSKTLAKVLVAATEA